MNAVVHRECDVYMLIEEDDGFSVRDRNGHVADAEHAARIAEGILAFTEANDDEIEAINRDVDKNKSWTPPETATSMRKRNPKKVYLMECGGKYKVGISSDVERRMRQLDKRPFPIRLIASSVMMEHGYDLEQDIHESLEQYRIHGEWFDLPESEVERLSDLISTMNDCEYDSLNVVDNVVEEEEDTSRFTQGFDLLVQSGDLLIHRGLVHKIGLKATVLLSVLIADSVGPFGSWFPASVEQIRLSCGFTKYVQARLFDVLTSNGLVDVSHESKERMVRINLHAVRKAMVESEGLVKAR